VRTNLLRVVWVTLPLTTAPAIDACLAPHSGPVRNVTVGLLAVSWGVALAALAVARPLGLTALRSAAPIALGLATAAAASGRPSPPGALLAVVATAIAAILAGSAEVGRWCAQGAAYGDEERYPLRVPPALLLTLIPLALALLTLGIATGPLLLAARAWVPGLVALGVGVLLVVGTVRSLHPLSRRWAVIVPAGFVVHDPMTMSDPILFMREHILGISAHPSGRPLPDGTLDLRLGASRTTAILRLDDEAPLGLRRRSTTVGTRAREVAFAPVLRDQLLAACAGRRLPVA
jgi:hypothetical protein